MNKNTVCLFGIVLILVPLVAGADGVGGAYWGSQVLSFPWESEDDPFFSSSGDQFDYVGGMGYGISGNGTIAGGFGVGISERDDGGDGFAAGFGGVITGQRIMRRPLNLLGMVYGGIGGVSDPDSPDSRLRDGVFAVMGEATLEASLPLFFFHPTLYAGYQVIASVGDGGLGDAYLSYSPTIGFRMLWGAQ